MVGFCVSLQYIFHIKLITYCTHTVHAHAQVWPFIFALQYTCTCSRRKSQWSCINLIERCSASHESVLEHSTPEMKDIEREKREISLWLPQTHVCLVLSFFTRFGSFSAQRSLCKGTREGKKRKLLLLVLAQHSFPSFSRRLPDPGSLPIVCLIDYFPCNYVCVILDFSLFEAQGSDPPSEGQQLHCSKSRMWLYY